MDTKQLTPCEVNVSSETGRLRAVLLHRPGVEIERMTPLNAAQALYSDILNKPIVDNEYSNFCGVLERWTQVYYVQDILEQLLKDEDVHPSQPLHLCTYAQNPTLVLCLHCCSFPLTSSNFPSLLDASY